MLNHLPLKEVAFDMGSGVWHFQFLDCQQPPIYGLSPLCRHQWGEVQLRRAWALSHHNQHRWPAWKPIQPVVVVLQKEGDVAWKKQA